MAPKKKPDGIMGGVSPAMKAEHFEMTGGGYGGRGTSTRSGALSGLMKNFMKQFTGKPTPRPPTKLPPVGPRKLRVIFPSKAESKHKRPPTDAPKRLPTQVPGRFPTVPGLTTVGTKKFMPLEKQRSMIDSATKKVQKAKADRYIPRTVPFPTTQALVRPGEAAAFITGMAAITAVSTSLQKKQPSKRSTRKEHYAANPGTTAGWHSKGVSYSEGFTQPVPSGSLSPETIGYVRRHGLAAGQMISGYASQPPLSSLDLNKRSQKSLLKSAFGNRK